ncbi:hypothetical protein A1F94_013102 [Pyrenophora tritici-repentis]|nr:hypothetical protein A1F94_013102 [Pyrenophora tritici-repentis]
MGRNCEKYLAKLEKHHQRGDYTKVEELWKKFGCLGRLHNLVRYIRLTPQRREEFATIIIGGDLSQFDGLELIQNNSTRWNSWFYSITRALNVRERLELFSARHVPGKGSVGIANFKLDGQHWFELERLNSLSKTSMLQLCFLKISETKDHYHDIHTEDDNNFTWKYLQGCADAAWLKCVEYYNNQQLNWQNRFPEDTDLPPAYYAAQILDPYRKWGWFRQEWVLHGDEEKKRWFENAQLAVKHLWETEYKETRKERDPDPAFDRQREHKRIRIDAPVSTTDLYEQYISTDRLHNEEAGCNEAIAYWLSRYDSQRDLARFALDISAKLTIVDRRGRLKADIIEACECLRAWYGKPQAEGNSDIEDTAPTITRAEVSSASQWAPIRYDHEQEINEHTSNFFNYLKLKFPTVGEDINELYKTLVIDGAMDINLLMQPSGDILKLWTQHFKQPSGWFFTLQNTAKNGKLGTRVSQIVTGDESNVVRKEKRLRARNWWLNRLAVLWRMMARMLEA